MENKVTNNSSSNSNLSPELTSQGSPELNGLLFEDDFSETSSTSSLHDNITASTVTTTTNTSTLTTMPPPTVQTASNSVLSNQPNVSLTTFTTSIAVPMHTSLLKPNSILNSKSYSSGSLGGSGSGIPTVSELMAQGSGGERKFDKQVTEEEKLENMLTSIRSGNMTYFNNSLKSKPIIPLTYVLAHKNTFLHRACESLKMTSITLILEKTKNLLVNTQNDKLKTPLYIACELGFFKAASALIDNGASAMISNKNKWNSLHKLSSLELKKVLTTATNDSLIGYSAESHLELIQKIMASTQNPQSVVAKKTNRNQTALHLSLIANNVNASRYLLTISTAQSLNIKDDNGNTPLHLVAYKNSSKMLPIGEQMLKILADNLNGENFRNFIDEVNNLMATPLQLSMKMNNIQLNRLIVKYRSKAESKILEEFFEDLIKLQLLNNDACKLSLESITYLSETFRATQFGRLFRRIVIIIKQHYVINMSHQNASVLLQRAKETIKRFFDWMDNNISEQEFVKFYKEMLFSQVYDTIIHLYQETNKSKDLFFQQRVEMFKNIEHSEIDITEQSWLQNIDLFPRALEIMNSLFSKRTPSEKINTLNEATSQISRTDANDLTPMFMYLLIRSKIDHIQSEFQFMDDFKETPEQEQYLVLLQGSLDYLETLNFTLRNAQNQIMSLSGLVERTTDNILSLMDEFSQSRDLSGSGADRVEDIDEGIRIFDEITLIEMLLSKLSNRVNDQPLFLPLKWSEPILKAYHFKAIIERLGISLDLDEATLMKTPPPEPFDQTKSPSSNPNNINNPGYICQKKGAICIILDHPYPQMVYQIIESEIRKIIISKIAEKVK